MKWEYKVIKFEDNELLENVSKMESEFNKLGSEGWEIVDTLKQDPEGFGWLPNSEKVSVLLKKACS
jgi:hypothetical protein